MTQVACTGGKVVLIDGPALWKMKGLLGIERFDLAGLYDVFTKHIGTISRLARAPIMTIHPDRCGHSNPLAKQLRRAGFELLAASSEDGSDDEAIRCQLREAGDHGVEEIVLVSGDQDFLPEVKVCTSRGIAITWVAARDLRARSQHELGEELLRLIRAREIGFCDLHQWVKRIASGPRHCSERSASGISSVRSNMRFTIRLHDPGGRHRYGVVNALNELQAKFPGLTWMVEE